MWALPLIHRDSLLWCNVTRCVAHVLSKLHLSPSDTNKHTTPEARLVMQQLTRLMSAARADKKTVMGPLEFGLRRAHSRMSLPKWTASDEQMCEFFPTEKCWQRERELGGRVEMSTVCVMSPAYIVLHVPPILAWIFIVHRVFVCVCLYACVWLGKPVLIWEPCRGVRQEAARGRKSPLPLD